jgi:hypothetical protein
MKTILLAVALVFAAIGVAWAGVSVAWVTAYGVYDSDAQDIVGETNALLDSYEVVWQLVYAGSNDVADLPNLANAANGWVGGDDVVMAQRILPQSVGGSNVVASDGTEWNRWMVSWAGQTVYTNTGWDLPGNAYQRIYQGTPEGGSWYFDSHLLALDLGYESEPFFPQLFMPDEMDQGVQPDRQIAMPTLAVAPAQTNVPAAATAGVRLEVTADAAWTARVATGTSWISIVAGTNAGNGEVRFDVAENAATAARTGTVVVSVTGTSRTTTVVQAAAASGGTWDEGYQDIGGGWRRLTWFGDYVPMGNEGWIWHGKHGFFFVPADAVPDSVWLFAMDMGWLWTGNETYPFLFRNSDAAWLWYNGATNPRWFVNMGSGAWENWP